MDLNNSILAIKCKNYKYIFFKVLVRQCLLEKIKTN